LIARKHGRPICSQHGSSGRGTVKAFSERCHGQRATQQGVASEAHLIEDRIDRVADTIVDEARSTKCDLVVMGTHGRRGFSHVLLGSDAERVVRQCPLPVLLVRHPEAART
jgi:hypothetical protein